MPQRVAILGVTGSGKSTLAGRVAVLGDLPLIRGDDLIYEPGWVLLPRPEQLRRIEPLLRGPRWVVDAVPTVTRPVVLERADLLVGLDYPRWLSLGRLLRRTVRRLVTRERFCNGNTEDLRETLSRDSILVWHLRSFAQKRREIRGLERSHGLVRLTSPRMTEAWLRRTFEGMAEYDDGRIVCDTDGITVHGYYFPWGSKRIHYEDLVGVARRPLDTWSGRYRIWGAGNPQFWFNLDPGRPGKETAFVLDVGGRVAPVLTPDDPDAFGRALHHHGVRVEA